MNLLEIGAAELIAIGGPLPAPTGNARVEWRERHGIALRLEADDLVGWGECTPLPGVSPDDLADGAAALSRLLGGELPRIDLDAPFRDIAGWIDRIPANLPAARFALDTALLDLASQAYGCPLANLVGEGRAPVAASTIIALDDWHEEVPAALAQQIKSFKIKVGRPGRLDDEVDELAALRLEYPDVALRLDANGAFTSRAVDAALTALATVGPEWVEQPVPPGMLSALGTELPCPIAADESTGADDDDLWRAVHRGVITVLVIKPGLVGGILRAVSLSERARSLGVEVVISHLMDGPIALAASAELAIGLGSRRAAGLGRHAGLAAFPPVSVPQLDGGLLVSVGPGLGVALE